LTVVFRNLPLTRLHPFAHPAAVAAVCAAMQSQFAQYHDFLFRHQDSLGTLKWTRVAAGAGVKDTAEFTRCLVSSDADAILRADSLAADKLQATGTPTVLVNGWRFFGAPSTQQLDSAIARELQRSKHAP
jgi:protein-disulfide isomerase